MLLPDDVTTAAADAGIEDPVDVLGALNTLADAGIVTSAHDYLFPAHVPSASKPAVSDVWDLVAQCESGGVWSKNTGNGYYGGLQEDLVFWANHGGRAYASRPDLAPRAAQIAVAQAGLAAQGWGAWPTCSRRLGLR